MYLEIWKCFVTKINKRKHVNYLPLEVVGQGSETELQVGGNFNKVIQIELCSK